MRRRGAGRGAPARGAASRSDSTPGAAADRAPPASAPRSAGRPSPGRPMGPAPGRFPPARPIRPARPAAPNGPLRPAFSGASGQRRGCSAPSASAARIRSAYLVARPRSSAAASWDQSSMSYRRVRFGPSPSSGRSPEALPSSVMSHRRPRRTGRAGTDNRDPPAAPHQAAPTSPPAPIRQPAAGSSRDGSSRPSSTSPRLGGCAETDGRSDPPPVAGRAAHRPVPVDPAGRRGRCPRR